jgi:oligopeptide/dipeptide ABC transporter ATP-binding protein
MYLGKLVEVATKDELYDNPKHPYTQALLTAVPIPDPALERPERTMLVGEPPSAIDPPKGCRFASRCHLVQERCIAEAPPLTELVPGHHVACWVAMAGPTPVTLQTRPPASTEAPALGGTVGPDGRASADQLG